MQSTITNRTGIPMPILMGIMVLLLCIPTISRGQDQLQTITGTVTSATDGEPLIGVSIVIKDTQRGTVTDMDGNYSFDVASEDTLVFTYIGYSTFEMPVAGRSVLDVVLQSSTELLDEVVVIGYGTQSKSHLTGSVSKVNNEKLDQIAVSRVDDALIGQVSGVQVQSVSAEAGAAPLVRIRGVGSINANAGPAVVVDGIVVSQDFLGNMDMNDIESFEVLKDASSAAIYGSEGSNGVIMITTKDGVAGKTKFSYETYFGWKEAFGSDPYKKSVAEWAAKELAETGTLTNNTQYAQLLVETTGIDRDWQDVFFDGGNIWSHSFSARGGSDKSTFSMSLRALGDQGVVITDDYRLYSAKLKFDTKLSRNLKFGISVTPSYSKRRRLPTSVHNPIRQSPWLPIYHTEETLQFIDRNVYPDVGVGDYFLENHLKNIDIDPNDEFGASRPRTSGDMNPYAQYVEREHWEYNTNLLGSTYLSYEIIDGLVARTSLGVTLEQRKRTRYDGTLHHASPSRAQYNLQNRFRTRIISDNTLQYDKDINNHSFNVLLGATFQRRESENSDVTGTGYTNDLLKNLQGATTISEFEEINVEKNKIGYFARINYAFDNRYLINASYRRDASSVFGVDSKWGNFPSVSVGWNVHNEAFFNGNIVSRLKPRFSYGVTGNENFNVGDDIINNYPYLALLNTSNAVTNGNIAAGVSARNIANTLLQWEGSKELNFGVDFGFSR